RSHTVRMFRPRSKEGSSRITKPISSRSVISRDGPYNRLRRVVLRRRIPSGDESLTHRARQAVHGKAAGRLAAAIKPRDHLAVHVDHLAARIDAQAGAS